MTVAPIQDLVADVMAAADPASQRIAARRLERLGSAADQNFAAEIDQKIGAAAIEQNGASAAGEPDGSVPMDRAGHAPLVKGATGNGAVYRKFEAFVLQMFVESMLPKDANNVFGKGTAGEIWRSMLAEQISNEMARGGGIGIAGQLAKSRAAADPAGANG
jgi:hypothetical protein